MHSHPHPLSSHTSPTPIHSIIALAGKQWCKERKKLLVLLDLWLLGLHLTCTATIDRGKVSITPARCIVRAFLASLHIFFIFMVMEMDLGASGYSVAGNHSDVRSLNLPPLETL